MTRDGPRYGRIIVVAVVLAALVWIGWRIWRARGEARTAYVMPDARAPENTRIKVEVLNATKTKGLARRATSFLRDLGYDVVGSGNVAEQRATTIVYDRSSHPEWARLVGKAMQASVESRPDSSRYLDVTVVLGANWHPRPLPFHP